MTSLARTHTPSGPLSPAGPASFLLTDTSVDLYRHLVTDGVDRVARRIGTVVGPVTGVTAAEIEESVAGIDLDRPLDGTRRRRARRRAGCASSRPRSATSAS